MIIIKQRTYLWSDLTHIDISRIISYYVLHDLIIWMKHFWSICYTTFIVCWISLLDHYEYGYCIVLNCIVFGNVTWFDIYDDDDDIWLHLTSCTMIYFNIISVLVYEFVRRQTHMICKHFAPSNNIEIVNVHLEIGANVDMKDIVSRRICIYDIEYWMTQWLLSYYDFGDICIIVCMLMPLQYYFIIMIIIKKRTYFWSDLTHIDISRIISYYVLHDLTLSTILSLCTRLVCWIISRIILYCIVLYCILLYCIVLYCIVLYCIVLYCIVLYCIW